MADERIVYSVGCTWWDSIYKASLLENGLPCCPFCKSVLCEIENEQKWWDNIDRYAKENSDKQYPMFMIWLKGNCIRDYELARKRFDFAMKVKP
jgi:hypothetical protein